MCLIYMITTTSASVLADGIVPLTTIARRKGCSCQSNGNSIVLTKPGYYKIDAQVTYTAPVAGDVTLSIYKNGVAVPGLTSTDTVSVASTQIKTDALSGIVRVMCCEPDAAITLVDTSLAIQVSNVSLSVEYLG